MSGFQRQTPLAGESGEACVAPRRCRRAAQNANLGSNEAEEIFMAFDTRIVRRFAAFLKPHPRFLIGALAATVVSAIAQLIQPLMIGQAVSAATTVHMNPHRIDVVVIEFLAAVVIFTITSLVSQWLSTKLAQKVIFDVRRAMFDHFQSVSLSFMDKTHVGRIMSRRQGDVNALQEFLESTTTTLGDMVVLLALSGKMLWLNWELGLLTLLVLPALIAVRAVWLPYSKVTFRRARDASSIANGALAENISGVRTVQESRREAMNFELFEEKARDNMKAAVDSSALRRVDSPRPSRSSQAWRWP